MLDVVPLELIIASNVRLFREALAESLRRCPDVSMLGTADSCESVLELASVQAPSIVVFDAAMSGALDLVRGCTQTMPSVRFVAVAVTDAERDVIACAEAGVAGYVSRDGSVDELVRTLEYVGRGELLCSPRVAASLFRRIAALAAERSRTPDHDTAALTQREVEIATPTPARTARSTAR